MFQREDSGVRLVSRPRFLGFGIGAIAGLIGTAVGVPLVGYAISPALRKDKTNWIEAGAIGNIKQAVPQKLEYVLVKQDGWVEESVKKTLWVLTKDGQNFMAYDPRCTHLGCAYSWQEEKSRFFCPCHDGIYDIDGKVIGGPPPRPLDRYEIKVENGKLYIGAMYRIDSNLQRANG